MADFPKPEDFTPASYDVIVPWASVPAGGVFRVTKLENIRTQYGDRLIATLEEESGNYMRAWVPEGVQKRIGNQQVPFYIYNAGFTYFKETGDRGYWDVMIKASERTVSDS